MTGTSWIEHKSNETVLEEVNEKKSNLDTMSSSPS